MRLNKYYWMSEWCIINEKQEKLGIFSPALGFGSKLYCNCIRILHCIRIHSLQDFSSTAFVLQSHTFYLSSADKLAWMVSELSLVQPACQKYPITAWQTLTCQLLLWTTLCHFTPCHFDPVPYLSCPSSAPVRPLSRYNVWVLSDWALGTHSSKWTSLCNHLLPCSTYKSS
jgi:hypothetical protein